MPAQEPAQNRNWDEDYKDGENKYECICGICGEHFFGHKRRPVCKICASNPQSAPETIEFWRHRALTAESAFEGAMLMLGAENGQTFMGEPVLRKAQPVKQESNVFIDVNFMLPEMNTPVLGLVGKNLYALARVDYDEDAGWLWAVGGGDLSDIRNYEADDDYQPSCWIPMPLPLPPVEVKE